MKKYLLWGFLSFFSICANSQGLFIQSGGDIFVQSGAEITIQNAGLVNNGTISGTGLFRFTGNTLQTISGTGTTVFHNIISNNTGGIELARNIGVNNQLSLTGGLFNIKNFILTLATTANIASETEANRITGIAGGYIEITVPIGASATVSPGNLGVTINPAANMGNVLVRRGHDAQTITPAGRPSVNRYYDIIPTNNAALNATITFNYFDAELNSRNENLLSFWTSPDNTTWTAANFSNRNTATNFVHLNNIASFVKRWTLTDQQFATGVFDLLTNNKTLKLWPNPSTVNNSVYIQLSANKRTAGTISVIDVSGKIMLQQTITLERGLNTLPVQTRSLAKGFYNVLIKADDGSSSNISFIQQ